MRLQLVLIAVLAMVGYCHGSAIHEKTDKLPVVWRKLIKLPREQRAIEVTSLLNPTTRSILDDQVIAFINNLLSKPNADPLEVPYIKINFSFDSAELHGNMDTVTVTGLSGLSVDNIKISPLLLKMDFDLSLPKLGMRGYYNFDGKLSSILPIYGTGPFTLTLDGAKIGGTIRMGTNLAGNVYIRSLTLDLGLEGFTADFEMLLGSAELSVIANEMINDIGMGFLTRHKNSIETSIADNIVTWFNTKFEGYTLKEIIDLVTGGGASTYSTCKSHGN